MLFRISTRLKDETYVEVTGESQSDLDTALKMITSTRAVLGVEQKIEEQLELDVKPAAAEPTTGEETTPARRPRRSRRTTPSVTSDVEQPVEFREGPTPTPEPTMFETPAPSFESSTPAAAPSADEAKALFTTYATTKGIPAARELLAEFSVARVTDIAVEQRAAFIGRIQELSK